MNECDCGKRKKKRLKEMLLYRKSSLSDLFSIFDTREITEHLLRETVKERERKNATKNLGACNNTLTYNKYKSFS